MFIYAFISLFWQMADILPDIFYRWLIRRKIQERMDWLQKPLAITDNLSAYVETLKKQSITIETDAVNDQHYQVPTEFFDCILGRHKKYSCNIFDDNAQPSSLSQAEQRALEDVIKRGQIKDSQSILDLGCGWGALSLFLCQKFPRSMVVAVCNSSSQKQYIEAKIKEYKLKNLQVVCEDVGQLDLKQKFDRIVSIELLGHVRNYEKMFAKMASWLKPKGLCFVQTFGHCRYAFILDDQQRKWWMARNFFTGGQVIAKDLFSHFTKDLQIKEMTTINGKHYQKTFDAWLSNMRKSNVKVNAVFEKTYTRDCFKYLYYWRLFFLIGSELFATNQGNEWQVYNYLLAKKV